jgi:hypothetical protein
MLFSQVSNIDLLTFIHWSMERILLLVDVAQAPAEGGSETDDAACEAATNSTTLCKEWTVTGVSDTYNDLIVSQE